MKDYYPDVTFEDGLFRFDLPNGDEFVIVPPKPQELSDSEIEKIASECSDMDYGSMHIDAIKFARAILKKASEK
jgi:hypothetical protein